MLIAFSDLHLTDQTSAQNVSASAFDRLGDEIAAAAGPDRKHAQRIDLLLLGDIFDLVRTSYWHDQSIPEPLRPWGGSLDPATGMNADLIRTEAQFRAVLDRILATPAAQAWVAMLNRLPHLRGNAPTVTYVVGNHDRAFHNFPSLRDRLQAALPRIRLQWATAYESDDYQVLARHGHEWDDANHGWPFRNEVLQSSARLDRFDPAVYQVQTFGEVITAELLSGIIWRLRQTLDPASPPEQEFLRSFQEVNNLRPFTAVFEWMAWFVQARRARYGKYLELLRRALHESLAATLDTAYARRWDELKLDLLVRGDLADRLRHACWLVGKRNGLRLLAQLRPVAGAIEAITDRLRPDHALDACAAGARTEFERSAAGRKRRQYVFYGHTHEARQDCFEASPQGQLQLYVNTGTFLPFVDRAMGGRGFWTAHRLTYVVVCAEDEDRHHRRGPGPTLDLWTGLRLKSCVD